MGWILIMIGTAGLFDEGVGLPASHLFGTTVHTINAHDGYSNNR